jgi:hypothetical protein
MKGGKSMTPLSFEWRWNVEYAIFMGLLYFALTVIGCGLIVTYLKTWLSSASAQDQDTATNEIGYRSRYSDY